jgi:hypothetical protein
VYDNFSLGVNYSSRDLFRPRSARHSGVISILIATPQIRPTGEYLWHKKRRSSMAKPRDLLFQTDGQWWSVWTPEGDPVRFDDAYLAAMKVAP